MLWDGGGGGKLSFMLPVGVKLRLRGVDASVLVRPYPCVEGERVGRGER